MLLLKSNETTWVLSVPSGEWRTVIMRSKGIMNNELYYIQKERSVVASTPSLYIHSRHGSCSCVMATLVSHVSVRLKYL